MKVSIMNSVFNVSDLVSISKKDVAVINLVAEYKSDPNCRAFDYVDGLDLSDNQKASFIYAINF